MLQALWWRVAGSRRTVVVVLLGLVYLLFLQILLIDPNAGEPEPLRRFAWMVATLALIWPVHLRLMYGAWFGIERGGLVSGLLCIFFWLFCCGSATG